MKLKKVFYSLISLSLIILLGFLVVNIGKSLDVFTKSNEGLSSESVFQRKFEDKIHTNIDDLLNKLLPSSAYMISVHSELPDKKISEAINMTPKKVTTVSEDKIEGDLDSLMVARPSSKSIRMLNKHGLKLPGLISTKPNPDQVIKSLPGFPLPDKSSDDNKKKIADSLPKEKQEVTFSEKEEDVYYNQEKEQTISNETAITNMRISVIIDEYTFQKLNLDQGNIQTLIQNVVGLNIKRGDTLSVELTEFQGLLFKFKRFIDKQKEPFNKLIDSILKINWILVIIILILIGIGFLCIPIIKKMQRDRKLRLLEKEEENKLKKKQALLEQAKLREEFKERRTELATLSESKPEMIAHHIMGWIKSGSLTQAEATENE